MNYLLFEQYLLIVETEKPRTNCFHCISSQRRRKILESYVATGAQIS